MIQYKTEQNRTEQSRTCCSSCMDRII